MFLQKSFIGKNKWYLYLLVLVLVFVLAQVGGIPFAIYAMMTNLDAVQAGHHHVQQDQTPRGWP